MFNAVDIIVVGRFSGSQALAAVGSTTAPSMRLPICLLVSHLVRMYLLPGSMRQEKTGKCQRPVHTAALALVSGIVMAFVGLIFSRWALELMGTPDDDRTVCTVYEKSIFWVCRFLCFIIMET